MDGALKVWVIAQECVTMLVLGIANLQTKIFDEELTNFLSRSIKDMHKGEKGKRTRMKISISLEAQVSIKECKYRIWSSPSTYCIIFIEDRNAPES